MNKTKTIFSGVFWSVAHNVVSILYGIISVPFLIDYFGKEQYGLIGLALSVNVYVALLDMGMTNTNIRFFSEYLSKKEDDRVQRLLSLTLLFYLIVGIVNTIILFVVSFYTGSLFKVTPDQATTLRNLLWILALNATFSWISVAFDQLLKANTLISWIQKRSIILKLLQFALLTITILGHASIEVYFWGYIFMATLILPLTYVKAKKVNPGINVHARWDKEMFQTTFPYALTLFSFSIFHFLAFNFRPLFLGNMSGPASVADYSILETIAKVVTVISGVFIQVLLPILTKMKYEGDNAGIIKMMNSGTKYVAILLSCIVFLLVVAMPEILTLYVGAEYTVLVPWAVLWLLTLLLSHRNVMTSLVFTETKLRSVAFMGFVAMCLAIACYCLFVPKYGVGGVVIGFAAHELTHTLFYYLYFLPRQMHVDTWNIFTHSVFPVWVLLGGTCALVSIVFNYVEMNTLPLALMKIALLGVILLVISWFVLLDREDKKIIMSLVPSKK